MNLLMDPLGDLLTTRPIQTDWEFTMEPYQSGQFGCIDDPDHQFGNGLVCTGTQIRSDSPEPLLTLCTHSSTDAETISLAEICEQHDRLDCFQCVVHVHYST
jgi:hypothetical protein